MRLSLWKHLVEILPQPPLSFVLLPKPPFWLVLLPKRPFSFVLLPKPPYSFVVLPLPPFWFVLLPKPPLEKLGSEICHWEGVCYRINSVLYGNIRCVWCSPNSLNCYDIRGHGGTALDVNGRTLWALMYSYESRNDPYVCGQREGHTIVYIIRVVTSRSPRWAIVTGLTSWLVRFASRQGNSSVCMNCVCTIHDSTRVDVRGKCWTLPRDTNEGAQKLIKCASKYHFLQK